MTEPSLDLDGPAATTAPAAHLVVGCRADAVGRATLATAVDLAVRLSAALHVVHTVDLSDYPIDPDAHDWDAVARRHLEAERVEVEDALAGHGPSWTYHAAHGHPVTLLRRVADDHDALMIVVGSRGEGPGSVVSRLLGVPSVSHGLIAHTHRPVLVVPPHAAEG